MTAGRIFVCSTCNRYAPPSPGEPTRGFEMVCALRKASAAEGNSVAVRSVECLNGCPKPCTAALRTPGKPVIRFSNLTPDDAPALIEAAKLHAESLSAGLAEDVMPARLRDKVTGRVDVLSN